jgi:hypothetical protein
MSGLKKMGWVGSYAGGSRRKKNGHKTLDLKHGVVYIEEGGIVSSLRSGAMGKPN